jgi:RNA polymerase sigma-70 factor (ECF subfamily)
MRTRTLNPTPSPLSDEQIVADVLAGHRECYGILYRRYATRVYQKCYSFARDPDTARDMAQEVLIKAFDQLHRFRGSSRFSTWLYAITYNYCVERYRKMSRWTFSDIEAGAELPDEESGEEEQSLQQDLRRMQSALALISEEERRLLQLKYFEQRSIHDLMGQFQVSESAMKMRLSRARTRVRSLMEEMEAA